jgi:D-sedoheptulose 7-phosphate isomerase
MASRCDLCLHAPVDATPLIQQIHITAGHIACGLVEERLFPSAGHKRAFSNAAE